MLAKRFFISGLVQGVGFRYYVYREVERIGAILGYVRNVRDGRVEVYAEAADRELVQLEVSLRRGPRSSHVIQVDVTDEIPNGQFVDFRIVG
jgi:acylphosphatase